MGSIRGGGRLVAVAWVVGIAIVAPASGQGWTSDRVDPKGHVGAVLAVAGSGQVLATGGADGLAKIWDIGADGKALTHRLDLAGHEGKVLAVAVAFGGGLVATGGDDRTVRLWDASDGSALATLAAGSGAVEALAFSPDGKTLASGGLDAEIRLWDVAGRRFLRRLSGHQEGVRGLSFSPDGALLASASRDRTVKLWGVAAGSEKSTLGFHNAPAWSVAFSPNGKTVASGGLDRTVRLWQVGPVAGGAEPADLGPRDAPKAAAQARNPNRVVRRVEGPAGGVLVQQQAPQVQDIIQVIPFPAPQPGDRARVQPNQIRVYDVAGDAVAVAFVPDAVVRFDFPGGFLAVALSDLQGGSTAPGSVVFLDRPDEVPNRMGGFSIPRKSIRGHLGPILGLAFAGRGRTLATVGGDGAVRTWNVDTAAPLASSLGPPRPGPVEGRAMVHLDPVSALAFTPDGSRLATAAGASGVTLWDPSAHALVGRLGDPASPERALAISPDGKLLASGDDGRLVTLRDPGTGREVGTLAGHLGPVVALAFSPDGKTLASASADASAALWDVAGRTEVAVLARHTSALTALAWRPEGAMLATAGLDQSVKLWEVPSGKLIESIADFPGVVDALAFSPDGKTLASADRSGSIRLRDVAGKSDRRVVFSLHGPARSLAYAPDGSALVVGFGDGSIDRLDPIDGRLVARLPKAHAGAVLSLAFGPGGKTLASGGLDREEKTWDFADRLAAQPFIETGGKVARLVVSPDGKTLATASADREVRAWDLATGRLRFAPISVEGSGARLAFSPDGRMLATLPTVNPAVLPRLWDAETGRRKWEAGQPMADASGLAFDPLGKFWVTAGGPNVWFWDLGAGRFAKTLPPAVMAASTIRSLAYAPDGKLFAVGLEDGSVTTWDPAHLEEIRAVFRVAKTPVDAITFSPDGRTIAAAVGRVVHRVDAATGAARRALQGPKRPITSLAFSPDGSLVASASDGEPTLTLWDAASGKVDSTPTLGDAGPGEGFAALAFAPDGRRLYAGGERGVSTFDLIEGHRPPPPARREGLAERATLTGHGSSVVQVDFAGGSSTLVSLSEDGVVKVWDLLEAPRERFGLGEVDFAAGSIAISPDGKALAEALRLPANRLRADGSGGVRVSQFRAGAPPAQRMADEVKVWDLATGQPLATLSGQATAGGVDRVAALAYSPDGKTLATGSNQGTLKFWEAGSLAPMIVPKPRLQGAVTSLRFGPDGRTLLGFQIQGAPLWDLDTGAIRAILAQPGGLNGAILSPDGSIAATWGPRSTSLALGPGAGGDVRLWDAATGRRVAVLPMPSGPVRHLAFSPDGKHLAASTAAPSATLWDVAGSVPLATPAWPSGPATALAYSPDGRALAIGGEDGSLRLWDVPAGTLRAAYLGHADAINALAFSPDGQTLASAGRDATVKLWDVPEARPKD